MTSASDDINVLLLGQTGFGKSTFINAFANHLIYNSLTAASTGELFCVLPVNFHVTNPNTLELQQVEFGKSHKNEKYDVVGQSVTQGCQAHIFRIGNRILRLIDTPGIGDVRGVRKDEENAQHILDFISQYKYLKGICILLKPNEERLHINFQYCVKELLTRLHKNAAKNIMFVFTNARGTFYSPGSTSVLLQKLLSEIKEINNSTVPFNRSNTYCIDNEGFRHVIANKKYGIRFPSEQVKQYCKSWEQSETQYIQLFERVMQCDPHLVLDTTSINAAVQYIHLLARPMSEVARLITENIKLAEQVENQSSPYASRSSLSNPLIQKNRIVVPLSYPRTICTSKKCASTYQDGTEVQVVYTQRCHDICYLRKVQQEVLGDEGLLRCQAFDRESEFCRQCRCSYRYHMHITYEIQTSITESKHLSITSIHDRIEKLRNEERFMIDASARFSAYVAAHAITPYNDAFVDYIKLFIREEEMKPTRHGAPNMVLEDLKQLSKEYERKKERLFRKNHSRTDHQTTYGGVAQSSYDMTSASIFELIYQLQELPINGKFILDQMKILNSVQRQFTKLEENEVRLPNVRSESMAMRKLKEIFNVTDRRLYDWNNPEQAIF